MSGPLPTGASPEQLSLARTKAGAMRARWLMALADERTNLYTLAMASKREGGKPLRALRVKTALRHLPGLTYADVGAVMRELRFREKVSDSTPDGALTIGWLTSNLLAGERRLDHLALALVRLRPGLGQVTSVSGFPYGELSGRYMETKAGAL